MANRKCRCRIWNNGLGTQCTQKARGSHRVCSRHMNIIEEYGGDGGSYTYGFYDEPRPEKWGDGCDESFTGPSWFQKEKGKRIAWKKTREPEPEPERVPARLTAREPAPMAHKHRPGRPGSYHMVTNVRKMIVNHDDNPQPNPTDWVLQEEWTDV